MSKVKGFYTDKKKRVRPITERSGQKQPSPSMTVWQIEEKQIQEERERTAKLVELRKLMIMARSDHPVRRAWAKAELQRKYPLEYQEFLKLERRENR